MGLKTPMMPYGCPDPALACAYYHKPLQNSNKPLIKGKLSSKKPLALAAAKLAAKPVRPANYFMYTKGNSKLRGGKPIDSKLDRSDLKDRQIKAKAVAVNS